MIVMIFVSFYIICIWFGSLKLIKKMQLGVVKHHRLKQFKKNSYQCSLTRCLVLGIETPFKVHFLLGLRNGPLESSLER